MPKQLSSRWTPFYKFALPLLFGAGIGVGALQAWLRPDRADGPDGFPPEYKWVVIVMLGLLIGAIIWWTIGALKDIALDDDELIISNYRTEIRVALRDVASISGPSLTSPHRYTITFTEPTEFGTSVTFIPPMDWRMMAWRVSVVVEELRAEWESARRR